jgi:hypothetical protein
LRAAPLCQNHYQNLGQVGKKNQKRILRRAGMTLCYALAVSGGCTTDLGEPLQSGKVLALVGLQGRWAGPVVPADSSCGAATQALMSIGKDGFGLDPFQSTTIIHGAVGDDGRLVGSLSRQGAEHQNLSIVFEGQPTGSDAISGTLRSGRCLWNVTLHRG